MAPRIACDGAFAYKLGQGAQESAKWNPVPCTSGDFREGKDSSGGARDFIALTALSIG